MRRLPLTLMFLFGSLVLVHARFASAQDSAQDAPDVEVQETVFPLDENGRLIQFERDIVPILRDRCLDCHGPEDAKNDFRVDDRDTMMDYIEPDDAESSTMYADYLVIDDEEMMMPPAEHGGPLSAGELALFRVWINEGAHWPEEYEFTSGSTEEAAALPPPAPKSLPDRLWAAQGFLHPATIHFPIALLTLGAVFVVLGWKWPALGTQIPLACLLIGAVSAVGATMMGWAFAPQLGYGSGWNLLDWGREVDTHRWSGVIVTLLSSVLAIIALVALAKRSEKLTKIWKVGLLVSAGMVGAVGHQGGELSYGKDFYPRMFRVLTGTSDQAHAEETDTEQVDHDHAEAHQADAESTVE